MRDADNGYGPSHSPSLVVDLGTSVTRAGWSLNSQPQMLLPTLIGRGRHAGAMRTLGLHNEYVGQKALGLRGILALNAPLRQGVVNNWDDLEVLWSHILEQHDAVPREEMNVLVALPPLFGLKDRRKLAELLLHKMGVRGVYLANKAVLAMYGGGRTTGICVDSGEDSTYVVPCWEGSPIPEATVMQSVGGKHVTDRLLSLLLNQSKYSFPDDTFLLLRSRNSRALTVASKRDVVADAKERFCRIKPRLAKGQEKVVEEEQVLRLPDGNMVVVGSEACDAPELLFDSSLMSKGGSKMGLHELVWQSVMRCQQHLRARLLSNIMLTGGNALLPGMAARLQSELAATLFKAGAGRVLGDDNNANVVIKVNAQEGREHFTWTGGAHLCSLGSFQRLWITKRDYDEKGLEAGKESNAFIDVSSDQVSKDT